MRDGTTAVELEGAHCLLAWPFAADVSLGAALAAVFAGPAPPPAGGAPAAAAPAWQPAPWLYLNFLLTNSQLFLPVLDQARGVLPFTPKLCFTPNLVQVPHSCMCRCSLLPQEGYRRGSYGGESAPGVHRERA